MEPVAAHVVGPLGLPCPTANRHRPGHHGTPWVQWFVGCVHKAADATWEHMQSAMRKTRFWTDLREQHPALTPTQVKAINKLYDVGPDGFANGISTEKHVNLCRVSRATAYRLPQTHRAVSDGGVGADGDRAGNAVSAWVSRS